MGSCGSLFVNNLDTIAINDFITMYCLEILLIKNAVLQIPELKVSVYVYTCV